MFNGMSSANLHDIIHFISIGIPLIFIISFFIWQKRYQRNIPLSKIRSVAIGNAKIKGAAIPRNILCDLIGGLPCCWWNYSVFIDNQYVFDISSPDYFFIDDRTGKILFDPCGLNSVLNYERIQKIDDSFCVSLKRIYPEVADKILAYIRTGANVCVRETIIRPYTNILIIGRVRPIEEDLIYRKDTLASNKARFRDFMREIKNDQSQLQKADSNKDGVIDTDEWDNFWSQQESEFIKTAQNLAQVAGETELENLKIISLGSKSESVFNIIPGEGLSVAKRGLQWWINLGIVVGLPLSIIFIFLVIVYKHDWMFNPFFMIFFVGIMSFPAYITQLLKITDDRHDYSDQAFLQYRKLKNILSVIVLLLFIVFIYFVEKHKYLLAFIFFVLIAVLGFITTAAKHAWYRKRK